MTGSILEPAGCGFNWDVQCRFCGRAYIAEGRELRHWGDLAPHTHDPPCRFCGADHKRGERHLSPLIFKEA
jgi:hypothetical protein